MGFAYTALVTILAIFVAVYFTFRTGLGRGKFKVYAPKMTGDDMWERFSRVHANTIEQMVLFMPALWLAAITADDKLAAGIGVIWVIGRLFYSKLYITEPKSRAPGMLMTVLPTLALTLIALYQVVTAIIA